MPYNPGNVRRLNALGGKRPQATGIAILPKNGDRVLNTSEGSVNNYGGNKKMGLYSNVGMSYTFQNQNLTGARINGNMPYFWGGMNAITKPSRKSKNMITVKMVDDGVRSTGDEFRQSMIEAFNKQRVGLEQGFCKEFNGKIVYLKGSVENRFEDIKIAIEEYEHVR